jgi:RecA-family ATPase
MNSGSGTSGSTAWSNSVRSRLFFEAAKATDGSEPDPDLRVLSIKKLNYGPQGCPVTVRWKAGAYVLEGCMSSLDRLALATKAEERFLEMLRLFEEQAQNVAATRGTNYAPARFAEHPKADGLGKRHLAIAMQSLLDKNMIHIETVGPPSTRRHRLVCGGK